MAQLAGRTSEDTLVKGSVPLGSSGLPKICPEVLLIELILSWIYFLLGWDCQETLAREPQTSECSCTYTYVSHCAVWSEHPDLLRSVVWKTCDF